jgi:hypothetical protein
MAIRYTGWENATILLGRQRINRTNQRFIGGVGWRQNEQTYDSLSLGYQFNSKLNGYYAYVAQVNRIFGPDSGSPPEDLDTKIHLIDLDYTG